MPDDFIGPRKLQIFAILLLLAILLYVPAYIAADLHDITIFKTILQPVIDDPLILLPIAGMIALLVAGLTVYGLIQQHSDSF